MIREFALLLLVSLCIFTCSENEKLVKTFDYPSVFVPTKIEKNPVEIIIRGGKIGNYTGTSDKTREFTTPTPNTKDSIILLSANKGELYKPSTFGSTPWSKSDLALNVYEDKIQMVPNPIIGYVKLDPTAENGISAETDPNIIREAVTITALSNNESFTITSYVIKLQKGTSFTHIRFDENYFDPNVQQRLGSEDTLFVMKFRTEFKKK